jgi:hypothetical protein
VLNFHADIGFHQLWTSSFSGSRSTKYTHFPQDIAHHSFQMKALEDDMYAGLMMLRRDINHLQSPLYRLPHELFPEVAYQLEDEADLVNLTHVSHRLRVVLLSHPSLWSHLDFTHATRAFAFLERSKVAPLRVNLARITSVALDPVELLRQHGTRILSLNLHNCDSQLALLSHPVTSLRRLEVQDANDRRCVFNSHVSWKAFGNMAMWILPSLTSLILDHASPTTFIVPNLTRFKFRDTTSLITIDQLLGFLDACTLLEHIEISYDAQSASGRYQLVSLPNLRTYTQTMLGDVYTLEVLDMLSLPSSSSVTLVCRGVHTEAAEILPRFRNPEYLAEIKRARLGSQIDPDNGWMIGLLEFVNTKGMRVCLERSKLPLSLESLVEDELSLAQLKCLGDLDTRSAEILSIDGYGLVGGVTTSVHAIRDALYCLGNVTTLILSRCDEETCLLALDPDGARQLPPVHTLIIQTFDLSIITGRNTLQTLLTIAQKRKTAGFPFRSVSVILRGVHNPTQVREFEEAELGELRGCIEKFELVTGDGVLDWEPDDYFFKGLEYLREHQDIHWD